ncbi:uncharacterized protein ATC70_012378 [Mucor velutinosus]|uniref:CCHC-type domain-containing protein n=1 Tax=Mucor velutinosus TaxID=708070 RepID=A0AAN7D8Z4_9FUNG|nr:hypothetical protein ATC70_012378 [Mucor velutinosus]
MHGEVVPASNGTPTASTTTSTNGKIKTRIWRNARTDNGYFLDISKIPNKTEQQHLQTIDQQYKASNFFGIKFLGKNAQRYIEVYPNNEIVDRFVTEGILYESEQSKIRLFPCKAIDGEGKLIQLSLTDIPFLPQAQLLEELSKALGIFGPRAELRAVYGITWKTASEAEEFCHATFPDMATWCRYCHEEGHTKFECPKALARIICYNCNNIGHRQDTCPKPKKGSSDREFKKARKIPSTTSSAEADKSKWAPSNIQNSDAGKPQPQGQRQQRQNQQLGTTSSDQTTTVTRTILQPEFTAEKQAGSTDQTNTPEVKPMSEDEDTDDDDHKPSASESENGAELMSDIEATDDEVANLQREQEEHPAHMTFDNGDSNTNDNSTVASPANYNDSTAHHQKLFLVKVGHPQTQSSYLRHIRLQQFNTISFQETHATDTTITTIELQLQATQYLWTYYCGIASFSSDFILTKIATSHLYDSDRYILCKVHHPHNFYEPFYILNLYAPATSDNRPRQEFFESIYNLLSTLSETIELERLLISGDFNYDYVRDITNATRIVKTSLNWLSYLDQHFHNCLILNDMDSVPTYQRALSTIDLYTLDMRYDTC